MVIMHKQWQSAVSLVKADKSLCTSRLSNYAVPINITTDFLKIFCPLPYVFVSLKRNVRACLYLSSDIIDIHYKWRLLENLALRTLAIPESHAPFISEKIDRLVLTRESDSSTNVHFRFKRTSLTFCALHDIMQLGAGASPRSTSLHRCGWMRFV